MTNVGPGRAMRRRIAAGSLLQAAIVALWLATFLLARVMEHAPHASLWFPPAAVTFAALLVIGPRALPAIIASCAVATYIAELQYGAVVRPGVLVRSSIAYATVHALAYGVPAMLLRRRSRRRSVELTLRSVTEFTLLGMAGALLAAVGGVLALSATGLIELESPGALISAWWLGDFVALLTLAPLFVRWTVWMAGAAGVPGTWTLSPFQSDNTPPSPRAWLKLGTQVVVTLTFLAAAHAFDARGLMLALLVVPLILQLWVVHTENRSAALFGVVLFSLLTVGAGALVDSGIDVVTLQFAAIGLAANTYFGLAVPALYASNERLREQVTRDRLTRVMTRAYFEDRATQELERILAAQGSAAVILLDLDRLKSINDTHGHAAGDAVLAELASRCSIAVGARGLVGRLSGDEFAVFLPGADAHAADAAIARMRDALRAVPFEGPVGEVTASFGRAVTTPGRDTLDALLRHADAAMYEHKRGTAGAP